jgi:hypothetical protein
MPNELCLDGGRSSDLHLWIAGEVRSSAGFTLITPAATSLSSRGACSKSSNKSVDYNNEQLHNTLANCMDYGQDDEKVFGVTGDFGVSIGQSSLPLTRPVEENTLKVYIDCPQKF